MPKRGNRIELPLQQAIDLVMNTAPVLRMSDTEFNLFMLIGDPGLGKTRGIESVVSQLNWGFLPYSPALERMEKFGGIPDLIWDGDILNTQWSVPQMIKEINAASKLHEMVVVLFDDWHLCDEDLQSIGFEVFTYYSLNGHKIAPNVIFVLAGNETSAAGAKVQLSAIKNRSTLIYVVPDVKNWIKKFAIPNDIHPLGISFFENEMNHDIFQESESANEPFGSARSWTSAFNIISVLEKRGKLNKIEVSAILQGSVSIKAAQRFMTHFDIFSKIDMKKLFEKEIVEIPDDIVDRFCYSAALNYEFYHRFIQCNTTPIQSIQQSRQAKYSKLYAKAISKMEKVCPEIVSMTMVNLGEIKGNKEKNLPSGTDMLGMLIKDKIISMDLVRRLKTITQNLVD